MQATDYFYDPVAATTYVTARADDAAKLLRELEWTSHMTGVLRAEIYGHSVLWDVKGTTLHVCHTDYEVLPNGADDYEVGNLQQVLAFILAKNW